ncbi:MAG: hypothetical protein ACOX6T_14815 [Myxococcales bacterium]|jgi:hypothetical protein
MAIRLGELLVRANVISEGQLRAALTEQQKWGGKLGEILVRMEFCSEDMVVRALSKQLGVQRADVDRLPPIPEAVLKKIPLSMARDLNVLPLQLRDDGKTLVVAMADPRNIQAIDELRSRTGCRIFPLIAGPSALARVRAKLYYGEEELDFDADEGFKVTDAQGRTVVKNLAGVQPQVRAAPPPPTPVAPPAARPAAPMPAGQNPSELLNAIEAVQRREVSALKAMVELLIEKGVFSREEYLARVKR